jgi:hypothetical protein
MKGVVRGMLLLAPAGWDVLLPQIPQHQTTHLSNAIESQHRSFTRTAPARSPVLLLLGLLASAVASICPAVVGCGSSSALCRPPPLFVVGPPRRAGWVAGLTAGGTPKQALE